MIDCIQRKPNGISVSLRVLALFWVFIGCISAPALAIDAETLWSQCLPSLAAPPEDGYHRVRHFGRTSDSAARLLLLIGQGEKTGTFTSPWLYENDRNKTPVVGGYTVVTDYEGNAELVLQTTRVVNMRFDSVSEAESRLEGPGARPLEAWRRIHWNFFTSVLKDVGKAPTLEMPVSVEEFEVVCRQSGQ